MSGDDPYVYPGSDVLRNFRDLRDPEQLSALELFRSSQAVADLRQDPVHGAFDLEHLQAIHRRIFGEVYPFAGEVRSVPLWKAEIVLSGSTVAYSQPAEISVDVTKALAALRDGRWGDLSKKRNAMPFAMAIAEVWRAHPFREGNTRAVLVLMDQFCRSRGMTIDFAVTSRIPSETRDAFVLATTGDIERLAAIIAEARQSQIQRQHPVLGLITSEAAEVMRLMGWPTINQPRQGETVRGQVLTTSYQTVLIHGVAGIAAVPINAFPEPPETNQRVSVTMPAVEQVQKVQGHDEWLIMPIRNWPQSVSDVAAQQAAVHPKTNELRRAAIAEFSKVWRDPEVALDKVLNQADQDGRISPETIQKIGANPETLGPLRGQVAMTGGLDRIKAEALQNVVPALFMAEHLSERQRILVSDLGAAEQRRRNLFQRPLPSLSAKAHALVKGVEIALQLPDGSDERRERIKAALSDKGALLEVKSTLHELRERFENPRTRQVDQSKVTTFAQMVVPERASELVRSVLSIENAYNASVAMSGSTARHNQNQGYVLDGGAD